MERSVRKRRSLFRSVCRSGVIAAACVFVSLAHAIPVVIVVNSGSDIVNAGDGLCTLREALISAASASGTPSGNVANECDGSYGETEIVFSPSGGFPVNASIVLSLTNGALPDIVNKVTISGPITIDGSSATSATRLLSVAVGGSLTATDVTFRAAKLTALLNNGTLHLGAGLFEANGDGSAASAAIQNTGTATIAGTRFVGNRASNAGAILTSSNLKIGGAYFEANRADGVSGTGGAILFSGGTLEVTDAIFRGNAANGRGGAIQIAGNSSTPIVLKRNRFENNQATVGGGALSNVSTIAVDVQDSQFQANASGTATILGSGGAIRNDGVLSIVRSVFLGNASTGSGGAIANEGSGALTLQNVDVFQNNASQRGGGIATENSVGGSSSINATAVAIEGNVAGSSGGGTYNADSAADAFNLRASRIGGNLPQNCRDANTADDATRPPLNTQGHNVISETSCIAALASDVTNATTAQYDAPAINLGSSMPWLATRKPIASAAVLDRVSNANWPTASTLATDIRNRARPQNATPAGSATPYDVGPFELDAGLPRATTAPTRGGELYIGAAPVNPVTPIQRQVLRITNSGNAPLTISGVTKGGISPNDFTLSLSSPIAPNATQTVSISCSPSAIGVRTATLSFATNDPRAGWGNVSFPLKCEGIVGAGSAPRFASSVPAPGPLNESTEVGTNDPFSLSVSNIGTGTLTLNSASYAGSPDLAIASSFPINIAAGASTNVGFNCVATAAGVKSGRVTINTNDPTQPSVVYDLVCNVGQAPDRLFDAVFASSSGLSPNPGPYGIALSPDGKHAYVVDEGSSNLLVYTATDTQGRSRSLQYVSTQSSAARSADEQFGSPLQVAVSPDGKNVYVTGSSGDSVATFARNGSSGALTWIDTVKNGAGYDCIGTVCSGTISSLDGAYGIAISPDGRFVYISSINSDAITVFQRNQVDGALSAAGGLGAANFVQAFTRADLNSAYGLAVSPDGAHVYATGFLSDTLLVLARNAITGTLTHKQTITTTTAAELDGVFRVVTSPDGRFVYTAGGNSGTGGVCVFGRDLSDGTLAYRACYVDATTRLLDGASDLALNRDGTRLFVTSRLEHGVNVFLVNRETGLLSFADSIAPTSPLMTTARGVAVAPDDGYLYATSNGTDEVFSFPIARPLPIIEGLVPASKVLNSEPTFVVRGSGFISTSSVRVDGTARPTILVSDTELRSRFAASDLSSIGLRNISVVNASGFSPAVPFTVVASAAGSIPSLAMLSPSTAETSATGMTVTVFGRDFKPTSRALWNNRPRSTTFVSDMQLQMTLAAGDLDLPGNNAVAVDDTATSVLSPSPLLFTVSVATLPAPHTASLAPAFSSNLINATSLAVSIFGSNFSPNARALWNGEERPVQYVGPGEVRIVLSAGDLVDGKPTPIQVRDFTPSGGARTSNTLIFNEPRWAFLNVVKRGSGSGGVVSDGLRIDCGNTCADYFEADSVVNLLAVANAGSVFTGWLGACTGRGVCRVRPSDTTELSATFALAPLSPKIVDADGNTGYGIETDAVLILRYLLGFTGTALTNNAIGGTPSPTRNNAALIIAYLNDVRPYLDIDGDGEVKPLTDGLLILRHLLGQSSAPLVNGALPFDVLRPNASALKNYLNSITP